MISWSYYGERCATFLVQQQAAVQDFIPALCGCWAIKLGNVLDFSDLAVLFYPNILDLYFVWDGPFSSR